MVISGILGKANLTGIDVEIETSAELYAGSRFPLRIRVLNRRRRLPGFMFRVHVEEMSKFLPYVGTRSESSAYIDFIFDRRGMRRVDEIYLCSAFPFNFFVRCRRIKKPFDFLVFPEPKNCEVFARIEELVKRSGESPSGKPGFYPEMISIRDYAHGDPLKYINWKATAKTDRLKTKELSSAFFNPVIISFDDVQINNHEEKLSCLAFAVLRLYRSGVPFGFIIRDKLYPPQASNSHKKAVLTELALYGAHED